MSDITARIHIATEIKQFKRVVEFQKMILGYPSEAIEAMFFYVQKYLKNECVASQLKPDRYLEIVSLMEFFKLNNYLKSKKWWEELYEGHLMNGVLEEIMELIM